MEKRCGLKAYIFFLVLAGWFGAIVLFSLVLNTSVLQETFLSSNAAPYQDAADTTQSIPSGTNLSMLAENRLSGDCCPSGFSSSNGCVCLTPPQLDFLRNRGGNRT